MASTRREEILFHAAKLFSERGVAGTTVLPWQEPQAAARAELLALIDAQRERFDGIARDASDIDRVAVDDREQAAHIVAHDHVRAEIRQRLMRVAPKPVLDLKGVTATAAGRMRSGFTMAASCASRGSGTPTTPTFGSMVQNG